MLLFLKAGLVLHESRSEHTGDFTTGPLFSAIHELPSSVAHVDFWPCDVYVAGSVLPRPPVISHSAMVAVQFSWMDNLEQKRACMIKNNLWRSLYNESTQRLSCSTTQPRIDMDFQRRSDHSSHVIC